MTESSVFISYSHDSPEHKDAVWALSDKLRQEGVDCIIDQYEQSPPEGWPLWCEKQVKRADFVLVICTEAYLRRFEGEEFPHRGSGGIWEGHIITQELYNAQAKNTKFLPILFDPEQHAFVPLALQSASIYQLYQDYELLYRRLTGQPAVSKPALGSVVPKAPRLSKQPSLNRRQSFEPIWSVRHRRSVFFTGREKLLDDLRQALETRGTVALSGLGGVGKTQTAVEYAYRYRQSYTAVFWVEAESREKLLAGFASMAAALDLPSAQAKEEMLAVAEVHEWLAGNGGWLLILDNADDLALLQDFLPALAAGHQLITTRAHAASFLAEPIRVQSMKPEEGALLLLRRSGGLSKQKLLEDADETGRRIALQLSNELGGLPLALDQAGAFMEDERLSLAEYAELYASERDALLAERGPLGEHDSVDVTFRLAFAKVAANNPAAADLVRLCAFLAADAIPEELFTAGDASILGDPLGTAAKSKLSFAKAVGEACRFSLLDRDAANHTLSIHRLVQVVIKVGMSSQDQGMWAERTVRAVANAFPGPDYENWPLCQKLIAHALVCAALMEQWGLGFEEAALLLNQAARYLSERALFAEAGKLYRTSLEVLEKALGPDHPDVASVINNLATLHYQRGEYDDAEPLHQRSLALRENALGPDHPDVATSLNNLAELYRMLGRDEEAEPLYQRALAILENSLGPEHTYVASSLNNLGLLYSKGNRYDEAEPLFLRSLEISEKTDGPEHPYVASTLNNLALLYAKQKRYIEAEPLYQRSLEIMEKALGPEHPDVATVLDNLAALYDYQGRYSDAEPLHRRTLAILETSRES